MDNPKVTHGVGSNFVGKDGIRRKINAFKYDDGLMGIELIIYWDGEDKEPTVTAARLGVEDFSVLSAVMFELCVNQDRRKAPGETDEEDKS
ncbi:MAG: hypothetical protein KGL39_09895 [Patescibacteria group bacterium]|nr:hypothetical protein [Patescibacteria group bacterium]